MVCMQSPACYGVLEACTCASGGGASHAHRLQQRLPSKLDAAIAWTAPDGNHKSAPQFGIKTFLLAGQRATSNTDDERPLFLRITPGRTLPPVSAPSGRRLWHLGGGQAPVAPVFSWHLPAAHAAACIIIAWLLPRVRRQITQRFPPPCPMLCLAGPAVAAARVRHVRRRRHRHHPRRGPPHAPAHAGGRGHHRGPAARRSWRAARSSGAPAARHATDAWRSCAAGSCSAAAASQLSQVWPGLGVPLPRLRWRARV